MKGENLQKLGEEYVEVGERGETEAQIMKARLGKLFRLAFPLFLVNIHAYIRIVLSRAFISEKTSLDEAITDDSHYH